MELDNKKLNRMKQRIFDLEKRNLLSNKYTETNMKETIKKIIKEEEQKRF